MSCRPHAARPIVITGTEDTKKRTERREHRQKDTNQHHGGVCDKSEKARSMAKSENPKTGEVQKKYKEGNALRYGLSTYLVLRPRPMLHALRL